MSSSSLKPPADLFQPAKCYSPSHIIAFLRQSRRLSDDKLDTFSSRSDSCGQFISTVLYPSWLARDQLLAYCQDVAERNFVHKHPQKETLPEKTHQESGGDSDLLKAQQDNSRLDPYSSKDIHRTQQEPEQDILNWVANEKNVESIIRSSTVDTLASKCSQLSRDSGFYLRAYNVSKDNV